MRWLGQVLQMKYDDCQRIVLVGQSSRAKLNAGLPRMGLEDVVRKDFREISNRELALQKCHKSHRETLLFC